jgi:acetyl esterase
MPVLPALQPLFGPMTAPRLRDPRPAAQVRAEVHEMMARNFTALTAPVAPLASERDHRIPVEGGEITVRVYSDGSGGPLRPGYVYFHGGGFWLGTLEQADDMCRAVARDADCAVASVDYRLAPEHLFPAAAEDAYAAWLWIAEAAPMLGIDAARLAVGGASAGGTLAAVLAQLARDRAGPMPRLQVLEIPVTDLSSDEPLRIAREGLELRSGKPIYNGYYLAEPKDALDPRASPLLAESLGGLPPALVMCAEYDPLRPEAEAYARRLQAAGVPTTCRCWPGQFHGSQYMDVLIPEEARAYRAELTGALRRAFGTARASAAAEPDVQLGRR